MIFDLELTVSVPPWQCQTVSFCSNAPAGQDRKILFKGLPENRVCVTNLLWLSNSKLFVTVEDGGQSHARLMLIDVQKTAIEIDLLCNNLNQHVRLSSSKRYLAYWEGITRYSSDGRYKIFDLMKNEIISETEIGEPELLGRPVWSSEDDILFYVADNKLFKFEILSKKTEILKEFDKNISISLQDYQENNLYYMPNETDKLDQKIRLHSFDIIEKKRNELWMYPQGPFHVYICKDLTAIYYKLGEFVYTTKY